MAKVYPYERFLIEQGLPFRNSRSLFHASGFASAAFTLLADLEGYGGRRRASVMLKQAFRIVWTLDRRTK